MWFPPEGDRLYVAGFEGGISVVDPEAGEVVETIDTPSAGIFRLALSPDGRRLYATDRINANLLVVDLHRNRVTSTLPALTGGRETRDLAVSSDGRLIYVANQDSNDLLFFDAASLQIVKSLRHQTTVRAGLRWGIDRLSGRLKIRPVPILTGTVRWTFRILCSLPGPLERPRPIPDSSPASTWMGTVR